MNEIKRGTGNGQSSCYGCEQKGKWNRNWITFLYEYDGELWCEDCLIEKLNKELKKQLNEKIVLEMKLKEELEDKRKEYQEAYKDVREEIKDYKNQQKEFIEWLKKEIMEIRVKWSRQLSDKGYIDVAITTKAYEEILSKYKEIIGDDKNE